MSKTAAQLSDAELKDHGNKLFAARKYDDAILCYNKAIVSTSKSENFLPFFSLISIKCKQNEDIFTYIHQNKRKRKVNHLLLLNQELKNIEKQNLMGLFSSLKC